TETTSPAASPTRQPLFRSKISPLSPSHRAGVIRCCDRPFAPDPLWLRPASSPDSKHKIARGNENRLDSGEAIYTKTAWISLTAQSRTGLGPPPAAWAEA